MKRRPAAKLWPLRFYVMDQTPQSLAAFANLTMFCETQLMGRYRITVIDLLTHPQLAKGDQILAIPYILRRFPHPTLLIIGSLAYPARVLVGLDLRPAE